LAANFGEFDEGLAKLGFSVADDAVAIAHYEFLCGAECVLNEFLKLRCAIEDEVLSEGAESFGDWALGFGHDVLRQQAIFINNSAGGGRQRIVKI
jgi:hypothetical protein